MASDKEKKIPGAKISPIFAARLEQLDSKEEVHAILVLKTSDTQGINKKRPTKTARRAAAKNTRESVAKILPDIDSILSRHRGKRLKSEIDALGAVPVITTPAGIKALKNSEHVKAILENQALFSVA